jgi:hypothetical protein
MSFIHHEDLTNLVVIHHEDLTDLVVQLMPRLFFLLSFYLFDCLSKWSYKISPLAKLFARTIFSPYLFPVNKYMY